MSLDKNSVRYQVGLLGVATFIASALLALTNGITAPHIAERQAENLRRSLTAVLPAHLHDNDLLADVTEWRVGTQVHKVYQATQAGVPTAVAFEVSESGYSGPIRLLMAVDYQGKILGVRTLSHTETPGLGDKIEIAKDDWILSFDGRSLEDTRFAVRKESGDFDQFTGATITPRTVVAAVKGGLEFFAAKKTELMGESTDGE